MSDAAKPRDLLAQDLRFAARQLRRAPGFALVLQQVVDCTSNARTAYWSYAVTNTTAGGSSRSASTSKEP